MRVPHSLDWVQAGAIQTFTTAYDGVFTQAGPQPGERHRSSTAAPAGSAPRCIQPPTPPARASLPPSDSIHRDAVAGLGAEVIAPEGFEKAWGCST